MDVKGRLQEQHGASKKYSETDAAARIAGLEAEVKALKLELAARDADIERIMNSDPLTGMSNRGYFLSELKKSISFARRSNLPLSIVMCDLDNFKFILDTYGHEVRDKVLVSFSEILTSHTRTEDTGARFGGDEFFLLLLNTTSSQAVACSERMWETCKELSVEGVSAKLSASFGIAELKDGDDAESIMKKADDALFKAKSSWPRKIASI